MSEDTVIVAGLAPAESQPAEAQAAPAPAPEPEPEPAPEPKPVAAVSPVKPTINAPEFSWL